MRIRIAPLSVALGLAMLALPAAAANAKPYDSGTYEYQFQGNFHDCGLRLHAEETGHGRYADRTVRGSDGQAFLNHNNYWFHQVITNRDNGKWLVASGHGLFKELAATHISGDIWEFTAHETGQPFALFDSDGKLVLRDRGLIAYRAQFDTLGDGKPGGEPVGDGAVTMIAGPHPSLDHRAFCTAVLSVIG